MINPHQNSAVNLSQDLSHAHRRLLTSLYHIADVLISEIDDSQTDLSRQQALESAASDLAESIEIIRNLEKQGSKIPMPEIAQILTYPSFLDQLRIEIDHCRRTRNPLGLLVLEFEIPAIQLGQSSTVSLDQFNRELTQILKTHCDHLGRKSNAEFLLAICGADIEKSREVAEELTSIICKHPLSGACLIRHRIGVAVWPFHASQREDLVYWAQRSARSTRPVDPGISDNKSKAS